MVRTMATIDSTSEDSERSRRKARQISFPVLALALCAMGPATSARPLPALFRANTQAQWRPIGLTGVTVHALAVGPTKAALVVAATEKGVYRYDRTGQWHKSLAAPTVWSAALAKDDTIVAGDNDGDVFISARTGKSWRRTNVTPLGVSAVSVEPGTVNHLLVGAGDGIYLSRDAGRHWKHRLTLPNSGVASIAWQSGSSRVVVAGAIARSGQGSTQVYISKDAGRTWHVFGHDLNSNLGIMSLGITASRVFAGTMGNGVWMAPLSTGAWRQMANGMPASNDHVAGIAALPGKTVRLVVGTLGYGVFSTSDGGRHWTDLSHDSALSRSGGLVTSIAYAPAQHSILAGTPSGVYALTLAARR